MATVTYRVEKTIRIISVRKAGKRETETLQTISNEELERRFDAGEDLIGYADISGARRPNLERVRRISVDVPEAMACGLDRAAARMEVD